MAHWLSGYVHTNGINLHYTRTGGYKSYGVKPQVVLCHGFSDNGLCWLPVAKELEPAYDLIMVDARGHGKSDAPENGYSWDDMADDVAGLIEALHLDRPVVVGHSTGASVTQTVAANHPDLIRAIVLEEPFWRDLSPDNAEHKAFVDRYRKDIIEVKMMSFAEGVEKYRTFFPGNIGIDLLEEHVRAKKDASLRIFQVDMALEEPWRESLARITCPVLLFTGNPYLGGMVSEARYEEGKAIAPQIERVHVDIVGHLLRYGALDRYLGPLKAFLAKAYSNSFA